MRTMRLVLANAFVGKGAGGFDKSAVFCVSAFVIGTERGPLIVRARDIAELTGERYFCPLKHIHQFDPDVPTGIDSAEALREYGYSYCNSTHGGGSIFECVDLDAKRTAIDHFCYRDTDFLAKEYYYKDIEIPNEPVCLCSYEVGLVLMEYDSTKDKRYRYLYRINLNGNELISLRTGIFCSRDDAAAEIKTEVLHWHGKYEVVRAVSKWAPTISSLCDNVATNYDEKKPFRAGVGSTSVLGMEYGTSVVHDIYI